MSSTNGPELCMEVLWRDEHLMEIQVTADNSEFRGVAAGYTTAEDLLEFLDQLAEFPRTVSHIAKFETLKVGGQTDVAVTLACRNNAGHVVLQTELQESEVAPHPRVTRQRANVVFEAEPMAIESFRCQLKRLAEEQAGTAILRHERC